MYKEPVTTVIINIKVSILQNMITGQANSTITMYINVVKTSFSKR